MIKKVAFVGQPTRDLEAELERVQAAGVKVVLPARVNHDESGREICRLAVILDPEGNPVMLHQRAAWRSES